MPYSKCGTSSCYYVVIIRIIKLIEALFLPGCNKGMNLVVSYSATKKLQLLYFSNKTHVLT